MTGIVKMADNEKGFGFIKNESGTEYFFHRSQAPDFMLLKRGDKVEFELEDSPKGPRAKNVRFL